MKRNLVKAFIASTVVMLGFGSVSAIAANDTANLKVKLQIVEGCTLNFDGGDTIDFGRHANLNSALNHPSYVTVACSASSGGTAGSPYAIELNAGLYASTADDPKTRRLKGVSGGQFVSYQVYQGATPNGTIWGIADADKIKGSRAALGAETSNRHPFVVQVPAQTTPIVDQYEDTLVATITYTAN